ncbi:MAG: flagellar type III secretion system protein FliR [candidate division Zixibacteria bacterium]|nr:flagellar type III secretion system protein FliR [candidate division Zixibacteria bacterium]
MDLIPLLSQKFEIFMLIFCRISGICFISPFLGQKNIPIKVKTIITFSIALLALPMVPLPEHELGGSLFEIFMLVFKEVSFGALLGFVSLLLFLGIQLAGQIIGFQMGFAIVNVIDPSTQTQISIISEFKYIIAILVYLTINGHHFLISAIVQSFQLIPPGTISFAQSTSELVSRACSQIFVIALKVAAPAMVTLFLTSLALGIIARTVPQMNVFIVGFPLKIGVGLLILGSGLSYFGNLFSKFLSGSHLNLSNLIMINAG